MDQAASTSPRSRPRTFSFRSDKSDGSKPKVEAGESHEEKKRRDSIWKSSSKANPNSALNEAQPEAVQNLQGTTLEPLRAVQHKDVHGVPIAEPDLANPTRPRWERPLDTIRSFEKAIDTGYTKKSSMRSETWDPNNQFASKRSSFFGGYQNGPPPNRNSQVGGYYGDRRPESNMGENGYNGPPQRQRYGQRITSDSGAMRYSNGGREDGGREVYPQHGYHQSHDTVNTGVTNGSDSTGPWANSTDPSSENSSVDKINATAKPQQPDGVNGYGGPSQFRGPIMEEYGPGLYGGAYPQNGSRPNGYPQRNGQLPPPNGNQPRRPIPLGGSSSEPMQQGGSLPTNKHSEPEKKAGWLKRRFSKKA